MMSLKLFNELKSAKKILLKELHFNKKNSILNHNDINFKVSYSGINLKPVAKVINHRVILLATGIHIFHIIWHAENMTVFETAQSIRRPDHMELDWKYLNVADVLKVINHLLELGRERITELAEQHQKSYQRYVVIEDFQADKDLSTHFGFTAIMKHFKGLQHLTRYTQMPCETYYNLIHNMSPFNPSDYWLSAKDLKKLGKSPKSANVIRCDKHMKKNLEKIALAIGERHIKNSFKE